MIGTAAVVAPHAVAGVVRRRGEGFGGHYLPQLVQLVGGELLVREVEVLLEIKVLQTSEPRAQREKWGERRGRRLLGRQEQRPPARYNKDKKI